MAIPKLPTLEDVWQQTLQWHPNSQQKQKFQQVYEGILAGNSLLNLTRITEPEAFWEKHLWDSLKGLEGLLRNEQGDGVQGSRGDGEGKGDEENEEDKTVELWSRKFSTTNLKVIDIGTGGGFPGIPVAIAVPNTTVTLLDSTHKKIAFLQTLLPEIGISNAISVTARAEEIGHHSDHREVYDLALIRAVGSANTCAEYALPLLKLEGIAVLYRGQWDEEDRNSLQGAAEKLGGTILAIKQYKTPLTQSVRHCIYLRKCDSTSSYFPRRVGIPQRKSL